MGLILDTSILVASDRAGRTVAEMLTLVQASCGEVSVALSTVTAVEFPHGIFRAKNQAIRNRREQFAADAFADIPLYPLTLEIAQLAGRIEGEQAARGNIIAFEDLIIGATALHLGYSVATYNVKHFHRIPGLSVVQI